MDKPGVIWPVVPIFLGLTLAWVGGFLWLYRRSQRGAVARHWPQVEATILNAFIYGGGGLPAVVVVFEYEAGGLRHRSSRLRYGGATALSEQEAEDLMARFPIGSRRPAYVNPGDPGEAVLDPYVGPKRGLLWAARFGGALLLGLTAFAAFLVLLPGPGPNW